MWGLGYTVKVSVKPTYFAVHIKKTFLQLQGMQYVIVTSEFTAE